MIENALLSYCLAPVLVLKFRPNKCVPTTDCWPHRTWPKCHLGANTEAGHARNHELVLLMSTLVSHPNHSNGSIHWDPYGV